MGVCTVSHQNVKPHIIPANHAINESLSNLLHFERTAHLRIKVVEPGGDNRQSEETKLTVMLTEPLVAFSQQVATGGGSLWGSACILPGLDPRGGEKVCQDLIVLESYKGVLLACEFDGHGVNGEQVVSHCRSFVNSYFRTHISEASAAPGKFLMTLNEECDKSLNSHVDVQASGCTAVMLLFFKNHMYFSCVGDSRAMLATAAPPAEVKVVQPARGDDKQLLAEIKGRRSVTPETTFCAVQMTQDQKPEDPVELARIKDAGGVVMRLEDEYGRKVGPYRVWKVEGMYPGIAMSRSLGDAIAHEIGVISSPIVTEHVETVGMDYFVVLASDGVWDVMENQEVSDFVEAYRHRSQRNSTMPKFQDCVQPDSVTIAQLLCEEARARWLSVVEAEDVIIDDISCIILELQIMGERKRRAPRRNLSKRFDTLDVPGLEKAVRHRNGRVRDPKRDPMTPQLEVENQIKPQVAGQPDHLAGALVKDPRRSSISLIPSQL